jgi:hypothetical protein
MWFKEYRDYETDKPLIKEQVDPTDGIIGCEMHDLNGWGTTVHETFPRKARGFFATLLTHLFRGKRE